MKYYFSLALVLSFSSGSGGANGEMLEAGGNGGSGGGDGGVGGWLKRIFGSAEQNPSSMSGFNTHAGGLQPSLDHIKLERYPFISIHLPFYNEKKVANRIISACTSMDYPNFEVIVCDDSTDETVDIVNEWKNHPRVKILHRPTREGFKGGALSYALKAMDPKTEFVCVFDADFVPYPDSLTQFVKYFKVSGGWSENKDFKASSIQTMPYQTFENIPWTKEQEALLARQEEELRKKGSTAVVAGYQWHVLNKSENWITRGVRTEYSGSYVIERPAQEIMGAFKIIHGSVYCMRADVMKHFGWGTSITEDYEMTLRIYEKGFKVCYTPYIQAPSECVSTIKRLIRQRMRWAEGHSFNTRKMLGRLFLNPKLGTAEKVEFAFLAPYYLQAFFFIIGTIAWLLSEVVFRTRLPFWTSLWGWSLVLTNFFAMPLLNGVGLFLEEAEEKDYLGTFSFIALSYLLVPFQAYAAVKGFIEEREGPWFRTPKTGTITDVFTRGRFYRWLTGILNWKPTVAPLSQAFVGRPAFGETEQNISALNPYLALVTANNRFQGFALKPRRLKSVSRLVLVVLLCVSLTLYSLTKGVPEALATNPNSTQYLTASTTATLTNAWTFNATKPAANSTTVVSIGRNNTGDIQYEPGTTNATFGTKCGSSPNGSGWILDTPFGGSGGSIAGGTWSFYNYEVDQASGAVGHFDVCVYDITVSGASITSNAVLYNSQNDGSWPTTDIWNNAASSISNTSSQSQFNISAGHYIYIEYWNHVTTKSGVSTATSTFYLGGTGTNDPRVVFPGITIPENLAILAAATPILIFYILWIKKRKEAVLLS